MNFKVGDKVVYIGPLTSREKDYFHKHRGKVFTITDRWSENQWTVSPDVHSFKPNTKSLVLADVYFSPLYRALKEE